MTRKNSTKEFASKELAALLKEYLEQGATVALDGLGEFRRGPEGQYLLHTFGSPKVFLAYVDEDFEHASRLCAALRDAGFDPWLDREKLLPGQNWPRRIENAIEFSDCFVALFSRRSSSKRGQFQRELRLALRCARQLPLGRTFIVPARLEECEVPDTIRRSIQYVDLFPDWSAGMRQLVRAIRGAQRAR